jgi:hypothetical protein
MARARSHGEVVGGVRARAVGVIDGLQSDHVVTSIIGSWYGTNGVFARPIGPETMASEHHRTALYHRTGSPEHQLLQRFNQSRESYIRTRSGILQCKQLPSLCRAREAFHTICTLYSWAQASILCSHSESNHTDIQPSGFRTNQFGFVPCDPVPTEHGRSWRCTRGSRCENKKMDNCAK